MGSVPRPRRCGRDRCAPAQSPPPGWFPPPRGGGGGRKMAAGMGWSRTSPAVWLGPAGRAPRRGSGPSGAPRRKSLGGRPVGSPRRLRGTGCTVWGYVLREAFFFFLSGSFGESGHPPQKKPRRTASTLWVLSFGGGAGVRVRERSRPI